MKLRRQSGITLLELLIVIAIMGILMGVGYVAFKPNHTLLAAQEFQAMMRQARFEAVRLTRPVEVTWHNDPGHAVIEAYVLEPQSGGEFDISKKPTCGESGDRITNLGFASPGSYNAAQGVQFSSLENNGVYWLPNGTAWECTSSPNPKRIEGGFPIGLEDGNTMVLIEFVGSFDVEVRNEKQ